MWIYVSVIVFLCQFASGTKCSSKSETTRDWIIGHDKSVGKFACPKGKKGLKVGDKIGPTVCSPGNDRYGLPISGNPLSCAAVPYGVSRKCPAYKGTTYENPVTVTAVGRSIDIGGDTFECVVTCKYLKTCEKLLSTAHQGYWNDIFEDDGGLQSQSGFMPYVWPSQMAYPAASTSSDGSISGVMIMVIVLLILVACMVCFGMNILVGAACYFVGRDQKNRGASYVKVDHEHDQI